VCKKRCLLILHGRVLTPVRSSEVPEVRNLLLFNFVQRNYRNRLIFAKVIAKRLLAHFYGPQCSSSWGKGKGAYTWYRASSWSITSEVLRYGTCF